MVHNIAIFMIFINDSVHYSGRFLDIFSQGT